MTSTTEFVQDLVGNILNNAGFSSAGIRYDSEDESPCTLTADVAINRDAIVSSTVRTGKFTGTAVHSSHGSAKSKALSLAENALEALIQEGGLERDVAARPRAYANPGGPISSKISEQSVVDDCPTCKAKGKITCGSCSGSKTHVCRSCSGKKKKRCDACDATGQSKCYRCNGNKKVSCSGCSGQGWGYVYVEEYNGGQTRHTVTCGTCRGSGSVDCLSCLSSGRSGMCFTCSGTSEVNCEPCNGKGKINCSTCQASGEVGCAKCSSTGYHTTTYTSEIVTSIGANYRVSGSGRNASQLSQIVDLLVEDDSFRPALQDLKSQGARVNATYQWTVPFSAGNLHVDEKRYEVNLWGAGRRFLSAPPAVDDLLLPIGAESRHGHEFFETLSSLPLGQQILTQAVGRGGAVQLSSYGGMLSREAVDALCEKARKEVGAFTGGLGQRYWWRTVALATLTTGLVAALAIFTSEHALWRTIEPKLLSYALALIVLPLAIWMIGALTFRFSSQRWIRELTGVSDARPLPRPWHASLAIILPAVIASGVVYWLSVDPLPEASRSVSRQLAAQPGLPVAPVAPPQPKVTLTEVAKVVAPRPRPLSERPPEVRAVFAGLSGVWRGRYVCRQGVTDTTIEIRTDKNGVDALANVKFSVPSGPSGEFITKGTFDPGRKVFQMRPSAWVKQPYGYRMFGMELQPGATANTLEGRALLRECSWIRLTR